MSNFQIHQLSSGAISRNSNIIHDTEVSEDEWRTKKDIAGAVADLASANVASPYDDTVTYAIGQYCLYEGDIYRCIAITTGAFDSTKWTQIVVTGEYRRVVELTSAQYTALSSAEKNNGTLYILTDEETTAADIPYSAGVSVADMLTPTAFTITPKANVTLGNVQAFKIGKMRIISLYFTATVATSSIFSVSSDSLPQDYIYCSLGMQQGVTHDSYGYLSTSGDFGTNANITSGKLYTANFIYIVA